MPDFNKVFTHHPPREDQAARYAEIRANAKLLAELIAGRTCNG